MTILAPSRPTTAPSLQPLRRAECKTERELISQGNFGVSFQPAKIKIF